MKKNLRILVAIMLIMVTTFGMNLEASAVTEPIDTIVERRADLPNIFASSTSNDECTGVQAMGVSRSNKNCLYTIKIIPNEAGAVLYYFPNISNWKTKVVFTIDGVGHANGMTVDTDYIYICAKENISPEYDPNNKIIRINRDYITSEANNVKVDNETTFVTTPLSNLLDDEDYKVMQPMIINPDESQRANNPYVEYISEFSTITRAEATGKFIISKKIKDVTTDNCYNGFTRAEIIGDKFIVSSDPNDVFLVENNITYKNAAKQDIYYLQGYGLFIGRWMKKPNYDEDAGISDQENSMRNPGRSVILWADIDGTDYYMYKGYRCYTPERIRVYKDTYKELGVNKYDIFEIESMGITAKGNLIATFNVTYTTEYQKEYLKETGKNIDIYDVDGIYKITRADGGTFKLS